MGALLGSKMEEGDGRKDIPIVCRTRMIRIAVMNNAVGIAERNSATLVTSL